MTATPKTLTLRVLATSDLHSHVLPYDYYADKSVAGYGLARVATLIHEARSEAENVLLVDNGDTYQGNPFGDVVAECWSLEKPVGHPMSQALSALTYDAATVGNHEFELGPDYVTALAEESGFPFVLSNVRRSDGSDFLPRRLLLERELRADDGSLAALTVGLLGFVPPQTQRWSQSALGDALIFDDIVTTAREMLPDLYRAGADIVIALCHSGLGRVPTFEGGENSAAMLATLPGITAVIAGHTHEREPATPKQSTLKGALPPVVLPGAWGSDLGVIDLSLSFSGADWQVEGWTAALRPVSNRRGPNVLDVAREDPAVAALAHVHHKRTIQTFNTAIGVSEGAIDSFLSQIGDDPVVELIGQAQIDFARGQLLAAGLPDKPLLAAVAPFRTGGRSGPDHFTDIPKGTLTRRNAADLYVFPNEVVVIEIDGAGLRTWLERAAAVFACLSPGGEETELVLSDSPFYQFDCLIGLSYGIDLSRPAMFDGQGHLTDAGPGRIANLRFEGQDVDDTDRFIVATNNYRLASGPGYPSRDKVNVLWDGQVPCRDVLIQYVRKTGSIDPRPQQSWRFSPLGGRSAILRTSPKLLADPLRLRRHGLETAGLDDEGFLRLRARI